MEVAQLKLDLGDIYILTKQPWEAFLVYEQVSKQFEGQASGNEARFRSARLSFYQGNFEYSNGQCQVLKAATSQLIANDALNLSLLITDNMQTPTDSSALKMYADAEMLLFRNLPAQAVVKLDSIGIAYPQNSLADAIMMSKAKILIQSNDFQKAADILKKITEDFKDGIWTDDALFTLADLYEKKLNDIAQAKIYFQKLITDYPGSMFSAEARKRFRNLRGDGV
jgi:tetratricopeptide (TPR) repeat protein